MALVYMLFALTATTILTAFFSEHIPQNRKGEIYIGIFVVFLVLAWTADVWLFPALAAGLRTSWPLVLTLIIFVAVFAGSLSLSVRTPGSLRYAVVSNNSRLDTEAAIFDLMIWFTLLIAGITIMRSIKL